MISRSTWYRAGLVAALGCALALAGCKGKDDGKKEKGETAESAANEKAAPAKQEPAKAAEPDKPAAAEEEAEPVQAEGLPTGAEVMDRFAEVTGGKAHDKIRTRVVKGKMSMPKMGLEGELTLYQEKPNKLYVHADLPGIGTVEQGFDGKVAWERTQMMGPRLLADDERTELVEQATIDAERHWRDFYDKAVTVGLEDVGGKPAYKVVLICKTGTRKTSWFDKESGLLVKTSARIKSAMGEMPTVGRLLDYREVDGIKMPFENQTEMMGQKQIVTIDSVKQNVELPKDRFDLPSDIAALAEGAAKGADPKKAEPVPAKGPGKAAPK